MKFSIWSLIGAVILLAVVGTAAWFLRANPWTGMRADDATVGATYRSLDECRTSVERIGGWCGENCKDEQGLVSQCSQLVQIPQK
jgi:hypothetical protein